MQCFAVACGEQALRRPARTEAKADRLACESGGHIRMASPRVAALQTCQPKVAACGPIARLPEQDAATTECGLLRTARLMQGNRFGIKCEEVCGGRHEEPMHHKQAGMMPGRLIQGKKNGLPKEPVQYR